MSQILPPDVDMRWDRDGKSELVTLNGNRWSKRISPKGKFPKRAVTLKMAYCCGDSLQLPIARPKGPQLVPRVRQFSLCTCMPIYSAVHKGRPPLEWLSEDSNPTPQGAPFYIASAALGFRG